LSKNTLERLLAVLTLAIIIAAWGLGGIRIQDASLERIRNISPDIEGIKQITPSVYEGYRKNQQGQANQTDETNQTSQQGQKNQFNEKLYIGLAEHPSYAGPLQVAIVVNSEGIIERVALVNTTDTPTYIDSILNEGILDDFLGVSSADLPNIDAISGATLSSVAMIKSAEKAVAHVRAITHQENIVPEKTSFLSFEEILKAVITLSLFVLAFIFSSQWFKWNKKYFRLGLLALSTVLLGVMYNSQFSLSTLVLFLGGFWMQGLASYTALLCLILAILIFLMTRKNLYCAMICPFGGVQEGLGRITNCSPPKKMEWMKWAGRLFTLIAVSAALYFSNSSVAQYEPFGMAFSFIGSMFIFVLFIVIVVSSLVLKRPWCILLCPVTCVFDYLAFVRSWASSTSRSSNSNNKE